MQQNRQWIQLRNGVPNHPVLVNQLRHRVPSPWSNARGCEVKSNAWRTCRHGILSHHLIESVELTENKILRQMRRKGNGLRHRCVRKHTAGYKATRACHSEMRKVTRSVDEGSSLVEADDNFELHTQSPPEILVLLHLIFTLRLVRDGCKANVTTKTTLCRNNYTHHS